MEHQLEILTIFFVAFQKNRKSFLRRMDQRNNIKPHLGNDDVY